jgi:YesN/AraC family two-component response regulator
MRILRARLWDMTISMTKKTDRYEPAKILLVDDNESVLTSLNAVLQVNDYQVATATNVTEALHLINTESFDVLLCDLHMPGPGDGFTVVSAMRHTNPHAITLVLSGYPAFQEATTAILLQADEVLVKPMEIPMLLKLIRDKLQRRVKRNGANIPERVASILARDALATITNWLIRVERDDELIAVPLSIEQRTAHLPRLLQELVQRLEKPRELGTNQVSEAAVEHGKVRRSQGYTLTMLVEESRILQVSIFETLQRNLTTVDFSLLLMDIMTIADEVDSQLKQSISSFAEIGTDLAA